MGGKGRKEGEGKEGEGNARKGREGKRKECEGEVRRGKEGEDREGENKKRRRGKGTKREKKFRELDQIFNFGSSCAHLYPNLDRRIGLCVYVFACV